MSNVVNTVEYPFKFDHPLLTSPGEPGALTDVNIKLPNVRGRIPSFQAARLRTMFLEAMNDPTKIVAHACSYDGLSSRLCEEAGYPHIFLGGYSVASAFGLPDTGYIAFEEMCNTIQRVVRQVSIPVMADGDTGYGSPMNVKRTVEGYGELSYSSDHAIMLTKTTALAGAAGVMIEDQTWPKRKICT